MSITLKTGARNSPLSITQTTAAIGQLQKILPAVEWEIVEMSSPGDRDKKSDLRKSDPDFFTRDIDNALLTGKIDCAVHSAKDLPYPVNPEIDWFWLPWREDPRDVLIFPENYDSGGNTEQSALKIGISSERRAEYCRQRFPNAELLPIRGNIDERIAQLDDGKYDMLIMAAAGLKRLGLTERINEYISLQEMPSPPGQGYLALTFRAGDKRFETIRKLFVKPVVFAGSGAGDPEFATLAAINALKQCEVCLYDSLAPEELLSNLPDNAEAVYVGKRSGQHSKKQGEICELLTEYARHGKNIVRLKGGDPGVFGRLAEEVDALDALSLPFRVIPGISSLNVAASGTGMLLTRRGLSRGFSVMTPREAGSAKFAEIDGSEYSKFPLAFFMGTAVMKDIVKNLIAEGRNPNEPAAVVCGAGTTEENIISGTIANIAEKYVEQKKSSQPGLLLIGPTADKKYLYKNHGALAGKKVLITCSEALQKKTLCELRNYGATPIQLPLIKTQFSQSAHSPSVVQPSPVVHTESNSLQNIKTTQNSTSLDPALDFINFDYGNDLDSTKRTLPHWGQSGVTYFITFRLADSIPQSTINKIKEERELWIKQHSSPVADNNNLNSSSITSQHNTLSAHSPSVVQPSPVVHAESHSSQNIKTTPNSSTHSSFSFAELSPLEKREYYRLFSKKIQYLLDYGTGSCCLKKPEIGKIVADSLQYYNGEKYQLGEWVVMPNHVHVVVTPLGENTLPDIIHGWKSFTAHRINKIIGGTGQLWQHESYDHIVRNREQLDAIEKYIRKNPGKIGLKQYYASFMAGEKVEGEGGNNRCRVGKVVGVSENQACTSGDACTTEGGRVNNIWCQDLTTEGESADWYLFTSPSSVRIFFDEIMKNCDIRRLPKIMVCGPGTACEFRKFHIEPDLIASQNYGAAGILESAKSALKTGEKIVRWCSDKAGKELSCELRRFGCSVEDVILYHNTVINYDNLPDFDSAIFASASAVNAFISNFGADALSGKVVSVIGQPTLDAVNSAGIKCTTVKAYEATIPGTCAKLAEFYINNKLITL
jgi:uroporphyrinogen III methyltransferase/synthase